MSYERIWRKVLFRLDPELAHRIGMRMLAYELVRSSVPVDDRLRTKAFDTTLPHPLGLAPGFDKNAEAVEGLARLGFSFVEVGTVTPRPQPGNEKPRMFRLEEDHALINRLGFNNDGAAAVGRRLERDRPDCVIGANVGMNRDTPLESAVEDYVDAAKLVSPHVDYVCVNLSSPNTPGLRELQTIDHISRITGELKFVRRLILKLSPDEPDELLGEIAAFAQSAGLYGIAVTNTTLSREGLASGRRDEEGGLSGAPLRERANHVCRLIREKAPGLFLIGVGGITTGKDLLDRLESGANVCQIYTALVYRGPKAVRKILEEYLELC